MCQHSDSDSDSDSSVKFQVVSGIELQVFDTMESCAPCVHLPLLQYTTSQEAFLAGLRVRNTLI